MEWVLDVEKREWRLEVMPDHDVIADAGVIDCRDEPEFFLEHRVQITDTLAEICHTYKLTPSELRKANPDGLDSSSSSLPNGFLRIPYRPNGIPVVEKNIEVKQLFPVPTPEDKVKHMCQACRDMSPTEAKCYLELNDWDLMHSLKNAQEDGFGLKQSNAKAH
jgi:hypothetical protein